jgi:hypothetical protein
VAQTPAGKGQSARYRTYLLTCWQELDEVTGTVTWRFKLEAPRSGWWRLFLTLKGVMVAIETELHDEVVSE